MFEMYANPDTSFGDITRYFAQQGISFNSKGLQRTTLFIPFAESVYTQIDSNLYKFFKGQGADIVNDAIDFTDTNSCYLYQGRDIAENKNYNLKDHIPVIATHEGIVSSDLWLQCRKRLLSNRWYTQGEVHMACRENQVQTRCGAGLISESNPTDISYLRCRKRADRKSCGDYGTLQVREMKQSIYGEMIRNMDEFQTLTGSNSAKANLKLTALNIELARIDTGVKKLLNTLIGANAVLIFYASNRIEE